MAARLIHSEKRSRRAHDACLRVEVILGVDTHRDTHAVVLVDLLGRLVATATFPTTRPGLRALTKP
jgi:transposase